MKISYPENFDINSIDTLIFDWGGVITNISPMASIKALQDLGHQHIYEFFGPNPGNDLFFRLELGKVAPEEVYEILNEGLEIKTTPDVLRKAICAMMLDTPPVRLKLLQNLRSCFQLILLSNTNIIHTTYYNDHLQKKHSTDLHSIFHKVYYSNELGLRKPGPEVFEKVISDSGINPQNTLFLDDTKTNIETARSLRIKCILIDEEFTIEKIFNDWLL
jgi:glucose-1-phosphatase